MIRSFFIFAIVFLLFVGGCKRGSGMLIIKDFGNGMRYEKWSDVNAGPRVLVKAGFNGSNSFEIIVPGDVVWCQIRGRYIFGEKTPSERPTAWMSSDWGRTGFFLVDPLAIDPNASSDDERYGKAVKWFDSKQSLEQAVQAVQ